MPELPDEAFDRLREDHGLTSRDAAILVALGEGIEEDATASSSATSDVEQEEEQSAGSGVRFFDLVANGRNGKIVANWSVTLSHRRVCLLMTATGSSTSYWVDWRKRGSRSLLPRSPLVNWGLSSTPWVTTSSLVSLIPSECHKD